MNTDVPARSKPPGIKPDRRFLRFDWLFNDALRSKKRSKLIEVLLRLQLPGRRARRMADNLLKEDL
jgi:hypothetical protein